MFYIVGRHRVGAAMLRLQPEPGTPPYRVLKSVAAQPLTDLLCHPFVHVASTLERTLLLAGNLGLTGNVLGLTGPVPVTERLPGR